LRPRSIIVLPILFILLSCDGTGSQPPTETIAANVSAGSMAGGNKVIGVMTRNLYLGADLTQVIAARTLPEFLAATTAAWKMVQNNDFHQRAQALADEIAANRPALVGLQEAFTWRTQTPADGAATSATTVAYDYVPELLAALARRGVKYRAVAEVELLDFEAPTLLGNDARMTDHGAILAREDVQTSNPAEVVYKNLLPLSVLGQPLFVKRGYVAVDVKYRAEELRFVSTHLESFHAGIRMLQAGELAAALAAETRPVILVGDLNSHPGTDAEAILAGAGFSDAWAAVHPGAEGLTCCWAEDLRIPAGPTNRFVERIDYVLTRGLFQPRAATITGANAALRIGGLWPSDHGGLFAEVRIGDPRFDR
jgi:endonuclease/exonuclease/phosphatase family metal-dependent hydrolase